MHCVQSHSYLIPLQLTEDKASKKRIDNQYDDWQQIV